MTIQAHYQSSTVTLMHKCMKQTAPHGEVCLLDLKSIRMMKGRAREGVGGSGGGGWGVVCGEVRVPTQMLSPPIRGLVARRPEPPSQYGVRKM